jgi:hypothetical protein
MKKEYFDCRLCFCPRKRPLGYYILLKVVISDIKHTWQEYNLLLIGISWGRLGQGVAGRKVDRLGCLAALLLIVQVVQHRLNRISD